MTYDQDANAVVDHAKEEVVRECPEVNTPEVILSDGVRLWRLRCLLKVQLKFGIKLLSELPSGDTFVVIHYPPDIRMDVLVKF